MMVKTIDNKTFEIIDENKTPAAKLTYSTSAFMNGEIKTDNHYILSGIASGTWITYLNNDLLKNIKSKIRVQLGGIISVRLLYRKQKYLFKKSAGWKLRFILTNKEGEELLTLKPIINWQKESHDYILQLNDEFANECDSFLILQAVHCANCSLSMMTGGNVPALISI